MVNGQVWLYSMFRHGSLVTIDEMKLMYCIRIVCPWYHAMIAYLLCFLNLYIVTIMEWCWSSNTWILQFCYMSVYLSDRCPPLWLVLWSLELWQAACSGVWWSLLINRWINYPPGVYLVLLFSISVCGVRPSALQYRVIKAACHGHMAAQKIMYMLKIV